MEERKLSAELMETKNGGRIKGTETLQFKSREKIVMFSYVQDCEVKDAF